MSIENVIRCAIEGGWEPNFSPIRTGTIHGTHPIKYQCKDLCVMESLLDPLFWQCLGKAMGWSTLVVREIVQNKHGASFGWYVKDNEMPEYIYKWHMFIEHLISGNSIESFFENL